MEEPPPSQSLPSILTPSTSVRRRISTDTDSNSPEFEFWMVRNRNPSNPEPNLLSADQLFSGGVLLPLHHLRLSNDPPHIPETDPEPKPEPSTRNDLSDTPAALTSSKRWTDIFKKSDKESGSSVIKEKKKNKKNNGVNASGAELNINIWPFSRSRSAGTGGSRPRSTAAGSRKVSSAPCSRSNSSGESKSRKCPSSPGRVAGGVHLGRSSPVWHVRKSGGEGRRKVGSAAARGGVGGGEKGKVLSLNVPMCIGYREHLSCKSGESSAVGGGGGGAGDGVRGVNNFFNIRGLFGKKVY